MPKELLKAHDEQGVLRGDRLLDGVRTGEDRAESLYVAAETILKRALAVKDLKTAIQSIRAAVDVMGEAREYLRLRGDLTGEFTPPAQQVHRQDSGAGDAQVSGRIKRKVHSEIE